MRDVAKFCLQLATFVFGFVFLTTLLVVLFIAFTLYRFDHEITAYIVAVGGVMIAYLCGDIAALILKWLGNVGLALDDIREELRQANK